MIVDSSKKKRKYTSEDKANLDIFCFNDSIGTIVNLSQEINTIMWDRVNRSGDWAGALDAYYDNCLLSILSEIAIDMTKREYPIDCMEEFKIIRNKYDGKDKDGRAIRPYFFAHVAKRKGYYDNKKKNYKRQMAPMDYLQDIIAKSHGGSPGKRGVVSLGEIISNKVDCGTSRKGYVDLVVSMIREMDARTRMLYNASVEVVGSNADRKKMVSDCYEQCIEGIRNLNINHATMRDLIAEIDNPENSKIRRKMWSVIFGAFQDSFNTILKMAGDPVYTLEECPSGSTGDVEMFGLQFKYVVPV